MEHSNRVLRRVLRANAIFSAAAGAVLLLAATPLSGWLGIEPGWVLRVVGAGLLGFAATLERTPVRLVIASDIAWVVGSAVLLAVGTPHLTPAGWWTIMVIADIVAAFAMLQTWGLRRDQPRTTHA